MWKDIFAPWRAAFEEAWEAFRTGSVPIGAALCDESGAILLCDRNRSNEADTVNRRISHAEANLLRRLDTSVGDLHSLTLYTTMEPCPMCMGTAVMAGIRHLRSAARDPYCGMVHLAETEPYYAEKRLDFTFELGEVELVQLTVQSYRELRYVDSGASPKVLDKFEAYMPEAVSAARELYAAKELDRLAEAGTAAGEVFDRILAMFG
ncbi:Cytidine and deoxycytidylate deaminase zinc-binding region [Ruminococcus sp. YRD2003]|uniref:nucleoside deaminase n=1 Tax=Ruminococcus sp. YRD2003 TaxID=1452313 RepID=UPI0008CB1618|nr:Cytidine and deoxycytidylate deaminase zinc-binding region [Ruminococcus flavefaciens]